jgi:hypothetical protein
MNTYSAIGRLGLVVIVVVVLIVAAIGIEAAVYSQQKVTSTISTSGRYLSFIFINSYLAINKYTFKFTV